MVAATLAILGSAFGEGPIAEQVEIGKRAAGRFDQEHWQRQLHIAPTGQRADISTIFGDDRKPIGRWNEGVRKLDVEWVFRLSPELMSRWLGFLSMREGWLDGEIERRWYELRQQLAGRPVFVVVLSSFPKKELFGLDDDTPSDPATLDNLVFRFEQGGRNIGATGIEILRMRAQTRSELDMVPWWQFTRLKPVLGSLFESDFEPPIVQRGDYHRSWWWVTPDVDLADGEVAVKVMDARKTRVATFFTGAKPGTSKG